jgi:uncharacterized membrane protein YeaQ/YmgE (transglycosylase-associated protein family)
LTVNPIAAISGDTLGILCWLLVGGVAGWLSGIVMKGGGYGLVGDIIIGLVGAVIGGFLFGLFNVGSYGLIGSILIAFVGACILIAAARFFMPGRSRL